MAALFTEYQLIIVDQNADWIALFVHYYPPLLRLIQNYSSVMHFDLNGIRRSFMDNRCAWDRKEIQLQIRKKKDFFTRRCQDKTVTVVTNEIFNNLHSGAKIAVFLLQSFCKEFSVYNTSRPGQNDHRFTNKSHS